MTSAAGARWLSVEAGPGFSLLKCRCGWREMCFNGPQLEREGHRHLALAHGMPTQASNFVARRRSRRDA